MNKQEVLKVIELLEKEYPNAKCELNYNTPFQLLVATVLSAQTTDKNVNAVTKTLFVEYPDLDSFLTLSREELENKIKSIGLYRSKSKHLMNMCIALKEKFDGQVPREFDNLITLAGVGRKTANVVISNAFNQPAIAVDTHVFRVSNRIGLAKADDVLKTELQLQKAIPKEYWSLAHHLLIWHGRRVCKARKPNCGECFIREECKYYRNIF
ncbi:endonuclease III [Wukongibacter baidiensis]|uniref:endonuclease III n=1 Tax=Wukongibacter baidiensis TaxID=1723361 RepID=UPI003D7F2E9B